MTQIALFAADDPRELPLIIATLHHFPLQHYEADGGNLYAVQDWIRGIALKEDTRGILAQLKRRAPETLTACKRLPYTAKDGKTYQRDFADAEALYVITQRGISGRIAVLTRANEFDRAARVWPEAQQQRGKPC